MIYNERNSNKITQFSMLLWKSLKGSAKGIIKEMWTYAELCSDEILWNDVMSLSTMFLFSLSSHLFYITANKNPPYVQTRSLTSSILIAQKWESPKMCEANDSSSHGQQKLSVIGPFPPRLNPLLRNPFIWPGVSSRSPSGCFVRHGLSLLYANT